MVLVGQTALLEWAEAPPGLRDALYLPPHSQTNWARPETANEGGLSLGLRACHTVQVLFGLLVLPTHLPYIFLDCVAYVIIGVMLFVSVALVLFLCHN